MFSAIAGVVLAGCSSSPALVTGQPRPAIDNYWSVRILTEMPEDAEEIAIVKASSDDGLNEQQNYYYATQKLRKQAAKVGANTVVITDHRTARRASANGAGPGGQGHIITSRDVVIVHGVAVWVEP